MVVVASSSSLADGTANDDFLTKALLNRSEHKPRPPPSKNSSSVFSNLHQQQDRQQRQEQQNVSFQIIEQEDDIEYFTNRRTSSLTYKPSKVFAYNSKSDVDLTSPFVVGSAEILRQKAEKVSISAAFAKPVTKPMLRCRSIRPSNQKQGPSVRHVPLSDDQWVLTEKEQQRLALKQGVGFGKAAEDSAVSFPTVRLILNKKKCSFC